MDAVCGYLWLRHKTLEQGPKGLCGVYMLVVSNFLSPLSVPPFFSVRQIHLGGLFCSSHRLANFLVKYKCMLPKFEPVVYFTEFLI